MLAADSAKVSSLAFAATFPAGAAQYLKCRIGLTPGPQVHSEFGARRVSFSRIPAKTEGAKKGSKVPRALIGARLISRQTDWALTPCLPELA